MRNLNRVVCCGLGLILVIVWGRLGLAEVVTLTPIGTEKTKPSFRVLQDAPDMFAMVLESPRSEVKVTVCPERFPIKKGTKYWVENYFVDPIEVVAQSEGVLELDYPAVNYNQLMISPTPGNLLTNSSFESVKGRLPSGWEGKSTTVPLPARNWWTGESPGPGRAIAAPNRKLNKRFGISDTVARTGRNSIFLEQNGTVGNLLAISAPVPLTPGKDYFLRGYFHTQNLKFGSDPGLLIELSAPGKPPLI